MAAHQIMSSWNGLCLILVLNSISVKWQQTCEQQLIIFIVIWKILLVVSLKRTSHITNLCGLQCMSDTLRRSASHIMSTLWIWKPSENLEKCSYEIVLQHILSASWIWRLWVILGKAVITLFFHIYNERVMDLIAGSPTEGVAVSHW